MDVFQKGLYTLLIRHNCEMDELQDLSLEDYIWFKLKIVHQLDSSQAEGLQFICPDFQVLSLWDLQKAIQEAGHSHFEGHVLVYSIALVSTLCYGEAVQYLYEQKDYTVEATHLCIAID